MRKRRRRPMPRFNDLSVLLDLESADNVPSACPSVRDLQASLFPVQPARSSPSEMGYLNSFMLKSNQVELEEELPRLKEPRDLFALSKENLSPSQAPPRWPSECQVLNERVQLISYIPSQPEQFYTPSGKEVQPKPVGEDSGSVVYQYYPVSAVNYADVRVEEAPIQFSRSSVGGSKYLLPVWPELKQDDLQFESRFESGNLAKAVKITDNFYELYLRADMYTNKHMQWFYFRITNTKRQVMYRLSIVNLSKDDSLYNSGMKPLLYSTKDAKLHSIGWRRVGDNISYFCNDNQSPEEDTTTYTLTFTLEFPHDNDCVYLAHSYPYTYSDLQDYLYELANHPVKSTFSTLRLLCRTLAGNNVYYVTITSPPSEGETKRKQSIVVTARVHPGETPASWMMKGLLDFLTGDSSPARELRNTFIFKIVPMLNPDGVIVGNNRCSLTGQDLNRQYRTVIRETYPSIWHTKLMIRRLIEDCGVAMYCDLHAHSRKKNVFIYGCENRRGLDKLQEQVFPLMLHKNAADKFSFESCKFRVQRSKEGTGRVVMWMMGIANSFTMEASFAGSNLGVRSDTHFSTQDYEYMGRAFCQTLLDFYDDDPRKEKLRVKIVCRLLLEGSNADEPLNIDLSDYSSDEGESSSSSDEGGRGDCTLSLSVPPPSPNLPKRVQIRKAQTLGKTGKQQTSYLTRHRRPFGHAIGSKVYKTTLGLSLVQTDYSVELPELESWELPPRRTVCRTDKPKKQLKKKKSKRSLITKEHSDTEVTAPRKSKGVTLLEFEPNSRVRTQSLHRAEAFLKKKQPSSKMEPDSVANQLAEVQARLRSMCRHRFWTGVEGPDNNPLSWGMSNFVENGLCISKSPVAKNGSGAATAATAAAAAKVQQQHTKSGGGQKAEIKKKKKAEDMKKAAAPKKTSAMRRQKAVDYALLAEIVLRNSRQRKAREMAKLNKQANPAETTKRVDDSWVARGKKKKRKKKHAKSSADKDKK